VLGQRAVAPGENEITAARDLLRLVDLKGALVTADALHCQRETAQIVLEQEGGRLSR
jgi:predicted transposase YbfD/YdcC